MPNDRELYFASILSACGKKEHFEAQQAGGGRMQRRAAVEAKNLHYRLEADQLVMELTDATKRTGNLRISLPVAGFPESWEGYETLQAEVEPGPGGAVQLEIIGARNLVQSDWSESKGRLSVSLRDLPLAAGTQPPLKPEGIRLRLKNRTDAHPVSASVSSIRLLAGDRWVNQPVVDSFGQRISTSWEGKIESEEGLRAVAVRENDPEAAAGPELSAYGGWKQAGRREATGFFRVAQTQGRWFFVDPDGYPFWSLGVTGIRSSEYTPWHGREWMFAELPQAGTEEAAAYMRRPLVKDGPKTCVSFYYWNLLRIYGSEEAWRKRLPGRLRSYGFNSCGNWSSAMLEQTEIPYTRWLKTVGEGAPMIDQRFPDVFDERWERWFHGVCEKEVAPHAGNPWILGWFVDNELPWNRMRVPAGEDEGSYYRRYADTYFSKVTGILHQYAPNHLYLGCRFVRNPPPDHVMEAAGRYSQVVTVNCYAMEPDEALFQKWHTATGCPILIGEHHFPLLSERQLPPLYPAFTAAEREAAYAGYLKSWASQPYSLGAHWFQWVDQHPTGRGDGENQTIGIVDLTDQPHRELIKVVQKTAKALPINS